MMNNSEKIILQLCADTGSDTKPYKDAGYDVRLIGKNIGVENYHAPKGVYGIIANPVCTEFSTARSTGKARNPEEGMFLVKECQRIIAEAGDVKFWVIENPAKGVLKNYLGKPTYEYEPWWFGSPWTKRTALWRGVQRARANLLELDSRAPVGRFVYSANTQQTFARFQPQKPHKIYTGVQRFSPRNRYGISLSMLTKICTSVLSSK